MKQKNWIENYSSRLWQFIYRRVKSEDDAWDIFQETIISASDSLNSFSGKSSFFTWLCAIARHEISDYYRKKKIKTFLFSYFPWLEELASEALGPEQLLLRQEFEDKVRLTLAGLSEGYSQILRLKYYQGLTVEQIALQLNESVKAVESRLFRARKAFAKAFSINTS